MSNETKRSIALHGTILAAAGIISKIIGFIYRIPMANMMGNTGNGLYSVAFGVYNIALTLSSYSMPLAVSKLMSERLAKKEYKNSHKLFVRALLFALITGALACLALYFGAVLFAHLYKREGLERPLRVLAPTTFIVAILGTCRGFFQGHRNMAPTAISQVLEQIVNAIVSVWATWYFVSTCESTAEIASRGAMGGTFGTLAGAFAALLFMGALLFANRKNVKEEASHEDEANEDTALVMKAIVLTVIPVIISQSIYTLGYTMDDLLYGNIMALKGVDEDLATGLQGVFNTQYNQMINLPVAIATAMASATLPGVVASYTVGKLDDVKKKISMVLKINMLIAVPSAVGLAFFANPIMGLLFPRLNEDHSVAVILLTVGSVAVIFYALSTLSTSILQGCNRMRVPVIHAGISLLIHIALVAVLLYTTNLGVYALVIGNVTFPMLVSILNLRSIREIIDYHFDFSSLLGKPLLAATIMGGVGYGIYAVLVKVFGGNISFFGKTGLLRMPLALSFGIAFLIAIATYGVFLGILKCFQKEELARIPIVKKFVHF